MLGLLDYVDGDLDDDATYQAVAAKVRPGGRVLFYLEVPPPLFGRIARGIGAAGLAGGARVMVEKPFGADLRSAQELNETMHAVFAEEAIYRVDHWLGLDPVENGALRALRQLHPRAPAQPDVRREHPDHHGGGLRRRRPRQVLRPRRERSATSCRTTSSKCWRP